VAIPLAQVAAIAGFRVTVIDDREEFASRERFPVADEVVVASVEEAFSALPIGKDSYVVAVTRGHVMDEEVVAAALAARARYIGMIGSRRKVAGVRERLRERGFAPEELDRVHAPIGIEIGSDTVEEIAISIVAELIAERRKES
jgi:xanthine dehydrogenase accessory factor